MIPPIPSELILTFAGFMISTTQISFLGMLIASTLGSWLGSMTLYALGEFLQPIKFEKWMKRLRFKISDIEKAIKWFSDHGSSTVFFCRFIPILRSLISIPAGMSKMNRWLFSLYTLVGSLIWNIVLLIIGMLLGNNYALISGYMKQYAVIVLFIGIIAILLYGIKKRKVFWRNKGK